MEKKPSYYSIIPAIVRYDKRLTPNAKLLYAEITSLCDMNGHCFATNDYFAKLYGVSKVSISKWINKLVECGYVSSIMNYKEGTKEILNRYLTIINDPIKEKLNTPIKEKLKDNNTTDVDYNNNIIYNNIYTNVEKKPCSEKSAYGKNEYEKEFEEFWEKYTPVKSKDGKFVAKGNKKACFEKFKKIMKAGGNYERIINAVTEYITYCQKNGYCTCGAEVYLNQRRYENDYSGIGAVESQTPGYSSKSSNSILESAWEFIRENEDRDANDTY